MDKKDSKMFIDSMLENIRLENPGASERDIIKKLGDLVWLTHKGYSFSELGQFENEKGEWIYLEKTGGESIHKIMC